MNKIRKFALKFLSGIIIVSTLTGCQSNADKSAVMEAAGNFLEAVKNGDQDGVNNYSSGEVATGPFVSFFDGEYLKEQLTSSLEGTELTQETMDKLDEFYSMYATNMQEYSVNDVKFNEDGTATVYATMKTKFPIDAITSEDTQKKVKQASDTYYEEHMDDIFAVKDEQGDEAAIAKGYNDVIVITMDIYEEVVAASSPETYSIAMTLVKNEETGTYYVTSVQSYDSSIAGTGAPATDTSTDDINTTNKDAGTTDTSTTDTDAGTDTEADTETTTE